MRILIVEDDHSTAALLQTGLQNAGYTAVIATDGQSGLEQARNQTFQLIILDAMLPRIGGIELCRMLRAERITVPILMLTALGTVDDRVRGLDAGADDYLAKPFDFREVLGEGGSAELELFLGAVGLSVLGNEPDELHIVFAHGGGGGEGSDGSSDNEFHS